MLTCENAGIRERIVSAVLVMTTAYFTLATPGAAAVVAPEAKPATKAKVTLEKAKKTKKEQDEKPAEAAAPKPEEAKPKAKQAAPPSQEPEAVVVPQDGTKAEIALAVARQQLGKPYRWAGSGPGSFDCSGLTSFAYRHAGVKLPHNSRAQYNAVKRIPVSEMKPGDLVFSGWGRIGHVGLYIGDGRMIHSPETGRSVEIAPLRRNVIGAGRPAV